MALYQYSIAILLAPLLAFAVIIFGTRPWDMLSRPRVQTPAGGHDAHGDTLHDHIDHGSEESDHGAHDAHGHGLDDDDDPKVPHLSTGAKVSAYVAMIV